MGLRHACHTRTHTGCIIHSDSLRSRLKGLFSSGGGGQVRWPLSAGKHSFVVRHNAAQWTLSLQVAAGVTHAFMTFWLISCIKGPGGGSVKAARRLLSLTALVSDLRRPCRLQMETNGCYSEEWLLHARHMDGEVMQRHTCKTNQTMSIKSSCRFVMNRLYQLTRVL